MCTTINWGNNGDSSENGGDERCLLGRNVGLQFDESESMDWIVRAENFFKVHQVKLSGKIRVRLAFIRMDKVESPETDQEILSCDATRAHINIVLKI